MTQVQSQHPTWLPEPSVKSNSWVQTYLSLLPSLSLPLSFSHPTGGHISFCIPSHETSQCPVYSVGTSLSHHSLYFPKKVMPKIHKPQGHCPCSYGHVSQNCPCPCWLAVLKFFSTHRQVKTVLTDRHGNWYKLQGIFQMMKLHLLWSAKCSLQQTLTSSSVKPMKERWEVEKNEGGKTIVTPPFIGNC